MRTFRAGRAPHIEGTGGDRRGEHRYGHGVTPDPLALLTVGPAGRLPAIPEWK